MTWVSNSCRLLDFDSKPSRGNRKASSKKSQHYRKLPDSLVRMTILPIEKSLDDDTKMVKAKNQRYSRPWMPNWMLIQRKWQWKNHQHGSWFFPKYMNGFDEHWYLIILSCWNTGSWYVVIHACKDRWIVAKFNDSVDASEIHHKRPRGILSMFIAWLTAFGISFPPERWVSLPPGSPGTPPSPQQRGGLYQDGIVKRLLRCGAEKDMPMQQGLKDLAVQSANQGRTCFFCLWHYIISMNIYTENINFFRLGVKPDVLCVLCTLWARLSVYHHSMVFLTEVTLAEEISSFYVHSTGK